VCQRAKKQRKKYGHLPPKEAEAIPWKRVNVDCIGPYSVKTKKGKYTLRAMTMIDPATGWFEIGALDQPPNSYDCQKILDSLWLARYPRPMEIGHDGGGEFKWHFKDLCNNMGLKQKKGTAHNPQSNAIIERVHQVLGNTLRAFQLEERELDETDPWDEFLSSTAYAIRCTHHSTLGATPGQLVFGRDMLLPTQFYADWAQIKLRKQQRINASNARENSKRVPHNYVVGDKVLVNRPGILSKMSAPRSGPYEILSLHDNGTVTISKGIAVTERINIRRLQPYFEK
jgi:hypothetical protein